MASTTEKQTIEEHQREQTKAERYAELEALRQANQEKGPFHIGGEAKRTIALSAKAVAAVSVYVGISVLFAYFLPIWRGYTPR